MLGISQRIYVAGIWKMLLACRSIACFRCTERVHVIPDIELGVLLEGSN